MRLIINTVLGLIILGLLYLLFSSIYEPINFKAEQDKRESAVISKLEDIRKAQLAYRGITGQYAHSFDTLLQVLKTDSFKIVRVFGNPDEEKSEIKRETFYVPAIDSVGKLGLNLDSLRYVPYSASGKEFKVTAQMIEYQSTTVPVVEVKIPIREYMGQFADAKYTRYDTRYNPDNVRKFGDLAKPSTAGNWE